MAGALTLEADFGSFERQFGAAAVEAASRVAMERAAVQMLSLVRQGFQQGGVNPETGEPGYWPKRKTPDISEAGVAARSKVVKKAISEGRFASEDELAKAEKRALATAARKFQAKTKKGIVRRIRFGGQTLKDSGRYFDSIAVSEVSSDRGDLGFTVGTNVFYAKYHEQPGNTADHIAYKATAKQAAFLRALGFTMVFKGTTIKLPKRQVFVSPKPWRERVAKVFAGEFVRELTRKK